MTKYDLNIFEVSAFTGEGVEALFQKTAEIANETLKTKHKRHDHTI